MIYLDSSCLLKLLLSEPESESVRQAVAREGDVVVSALTELETTVQLRPDGWVRCSGSVAIAPTWANWSSSGSSIRSASCPCQEKCFRPLFASTRPAGSPTVARWTGYTWRPWKSSGYAV